VPAATFLGKATYHRWLPTVLETLQTYRAAQNPVNASIPQNFHAISTFTKTGADHHSAQGRPNRRAQQHDLPPRSAANKAKRHNKALGFKQPREGGRQKIEKRSLGGPCLEGTLQNRSFRRSNVLSVKILLFRIKPRGRGDSGNQSLLNLRCRTRTRVAEIRPASHTNALG
jgi:hypothetical protein